MSAPNRPAARSAVALASADARLIAVGAALIAPQCPGRRVVDRAQAAGDHHVGDRRGALIGPAGGDGAPCADSGPGPQGPTGQDEHRLIDRHVAHPLPGSTGNAARRGRRALRRNAELHQRSAIAHSQRSDRRDAMNVTSTMSAQAADRQQRRSERTASPSGYLPRPSAQAPIVGVGETAHRAVGRPDRRSRPAATAGKATGAVRWRSCAYVPPPPRDSHDISENIRTSLARDSSTSSRAGSLASANIAVHARRRRRERRASPDMREPPALAQRPLEAACSEGATYTQQFGVIVR